MNSKELKKQLTAQFYRNNTFFFWIALLGSLAEGGLNLILSWIMQQLIDTASGTYGALSIGTLVKISAAFLLLCVVVLLLGYASKPGFIRKAMEQYKSFAFGKLMEKSISSFGDEDTALYLSALSNDTVSIEADYLEQQFSMITKAVMFAGALSMMLWYSPLMTAVAAGLTALPLIASILTGNRLEPAQKRVSARNTDFTSTLKDCLGGFPVVKSFQAEKEILALFVETNQSLEKEKFSRQRIKAIVGIIGAMAGIFAQLGVFLAGTCLALTGRGITPGVVIVFVNLMNFVIEPIAQLPGILAGRRAAAGLIDKLAAELSKNVPTRGRTNIRTLHSRIRLENVSFGYEKEKDILHDISFSFEAGRAYAVVGGSGSGKSTLLNLLVSPGALRGGRVLFDGVDQRKISGESLYEMISVIWQNVFVFRASLRDNITMFRSFPEEEIKAAVERAHLEELFEKNGGDYHCGENGKGLSGGEKQRVAIARSLLKQSSVLLADEATSALDAHTAWQVSQDILDLTGILRIVVTHSLEEALLRRYDAILVLKEGRIEETGTFDELMEKKGYFYALYTVSQ